MVWIEFAACSALMIFFAYELCKEGVILSKKTRIEEGLIGMFFLALATSFPEGATGATAVFYLGNNSLGYGDIMGSIIVNLMILLFLDQYKGRGRILSGLSRINRLTGVFALLLISAVLFFAAVRFSGVPVPSFAGIGIESPMIAVAYIVCLDMVRRNNKGQEPVFNGKGENVLRVWAKFIVLLGIVMLLGVWLAGTGEKIAEATNLSQTFVGMLFLGVSTSFPEMIVSFAALRAGSPNMAVGNILGSNMFDVFLIPLMDALSRSPILGGMTSGQMAATVVAFLVTAVAVTALYVKKDARLRINWDTSLIFIVGFIGFVILYFLK